VDGAGVSIVIEDVDGQVIASAGLAAAGDTAQEVRREIALAGEVIGNVIGRGSGSVTLLAAIVESVAASASAIGAASSALEVGAARRIDNARLEAELALARKIQRSFVPIIPPDIPGYEVAGHYEAAREVGGDFFDVFRVRGRAGRLAICIADVTGKGIAAALLMAFARPLLHSAVDNAPGPADALERTNRILVEERRSTLFLTALSAVVDLRRGTMRLANAGHEPPLLVPAGGGPITLLDASGPLLGVFAPLDLAEQTIGMGPGDLVLLYTDGVTDAQAPSGERFGDARLLETVEGSRGGSAADVVAAVRDACHQFQAEMSAADDVTIVAIRRNPRALSGSLRTSPSLRGGRGPS
jgi:sigma-B regulation protein RsbU (phosphoserine phosphatase)